MSNYNIQMKQRNAANNGWDNVYPISMDNNIFSSDGKSVREQLNTNLSQLNDIFINAKYPPYPLVGAKLDGTTDDTQALINIEAYCNTNGKILFIPGLAKISGGITIHGGTKGLIFDTWSYGSGAGSGLLVTGSGYTALTINAGIGFIMDKVTIHGGSGTAPSVNGILFSGHIGLYQLGSIRVYNLNGFGVKINALWDSLIDIISVEKCGTDSEYAFSINDDGDTTNQTIINRIQVEQSYHKAMYISPNTLDCQFNNIHSERTTGDGTNYTHILQGNSCTYTNVRVEGTTAVKVQIGSAYGSYTDLRCSEAEIHVNYGSRIPTKILNLLCDTFINDGIQRTNLENLECNTFYNSGESLLARKIKVNTTFTNNTGGGCTIYDSDISIAVTNSYNGLLKMINCSLGTYTANYNTILIECSITTFTTGWNGVTTCKGCTISSISITQNNSLLRFNNTIVTGNIANTAGSPQTVVILFDANCSVIGTMPDYLNNAPTAGIQSYNVGDKTHVMKPVAGGYSAYAVITAGTPGVWKGLGSLAA